MPPRSGWRLPARRSRCGCGEETSAACTRTPTRRGGFGGAPFTPPCGSMPFTEPVAPHPSAVAGGPWTPQTGRRGSEESVAITSDGDANHDGDLELVTRSAAHLDVDGDHPPRGADAYGESAPPSAAGGACPDVPGEDRVRSEGEGRRPHELHERLRHPHSFEHRTSIAGKARALRRGGWLRGSVATREVERVPGIFPSRRPRRRRRF
jgi:hypothetical protein